jgi:Lrp/AsnC family transcriptional regulator
MGRNLDRIDRALLAELQRDADRPLSELAERVNLSKNPCWRRVRQLEEAGYIRGKVALLDPQKLNLGLTVFVSVRTRQHSLKWFEQFRGAVESMPEIVELHRLSGDTDYLLRVVVPDMAAYDRVYRTLIGRIDLDTVSSSFVMEQLKQTTELPLEYA